MSKFKVDVAGDGQAEEASAPGDTVLDNDDFVAEVATIGVVAAGVAIVEVALAEFQKAGQFG